MQRQGQDPDGEAPAKRTAPAPRRRRRSGSPSVRASSYARYDQSLRQVAWPNRSEVINYTTVTLVTLLSLMVLIFILNYAFAKGVLWLFKT